MVYRGPSKGCLACLKRRVKCDERKPDCQRCEKRGGGCPGYRDSKTTWLLDMTPEIVHKFGSSQHIEHRVASEGICNASLANQSNETAILQAPLQIPTKQEALAYLINCYLDISPQSLDTGYLNVLRLVTQRQDRGSCLEMCLSSFALAAFSRRPASRSVVSEAKATYLLALKAIRDSIGDLKSIKYDELLASIMISALVEWLIGDNAEGYYYHLYGAIEVLRSWGQVKSHDDLGAEIHKLLRHELFRSSAIRNPEYQDQSPYHRAFSAIEIIDNSSVDTAQGITADTWQTLLISHNHKMIHECLVVAMSSIPMQSLMAAPSASSSDPVIEDFSDHGLDSAKTIREYLTLAANIFEVNDILGHSIESFYPQPCEVQSDLGNGESTLESQEYTDFGLGILAARLLVYNQAAVAFKRARLNDTSINTTEIDIITHKAQEAIEIIVGSGRYICNQPDIDGARPDDYIWLHRWIPFRIAMVSPFITAEQRRSIGLILQYALKVKGISMVGAIHNQTGH